MKEKIVHLMKSEGLTSSRLAEILETQPSRISHIVSGRNKPSFDLLQQILRRFPRINPDWLLLDSPTMYRHDGGGPVISLEEEPSSSGAIDLFGLGEIIAPNSSVDSPLDSAINLGENSTQFRAQNGVQNGAKNNLQNGGKNAHQNHPQNWGQNGPQNSPQNGGQNLPFFGESTSEVQRVIVLYSDGTFRTYNAR